jgi:single-strand DNA-binding protein
MRSLNRAQIIGNLTRDPELRTTTTGRNVCSFGIATNYEYKDSAGQKVEQVEFHNVVAWGKLAEICSQYLGKGRKVYVDGRLQTREWQGQDGNKRRTTEIVIENMIMLSSAPGTHGGNAASGTQAAPAPAPQSAPPAAENIPTISYDEPAPLGHSPLGRSPTGEPTGEATQSGVTEEEVNVEEIPF